MVLTLSREVLCGWLPFWWLVSTFVFAAFTCLGLSRCTFRKLGSVIQNDDGAGYTLTYVMVLPVYILLLAVLIESTWMMLAKIGTVYSAYTGARSAIVWNTATSESDFSAKVETAAKRAFVPFASGTTGARLIVNQGQTADSDFVQAYEHFAKQAGVEQVSTKYVRAKFAHAFSPDVVEVEIELIPKGQEVWDEDMSCTVRYNFPLQAPIIDRIMGHQGSSGYVFPIATTVTLQNEAPQNPEKLLGISYASP